MKNSILLIVIIIVLIGAVSFLILNNRSTSSTTTTENTQQDENNNSTQKVEGYSGNVLAGSTTPFIEFNTADYEEAKSEGKIIVLDFYADWCPVCRAEAPGINEGFEALDRPDVVGFRVNYNDPDTDDEERALAKEFEVTYQHTKVVLKDGRVQYKSLETWDSNTLHSVISKIN